ncbi:hypothetical protein EX30DRAFT_325858 [Ascodesmis nigricans]|uniref:Uncharacterized protein n=1 Tax=Ascodesmis nigricans TaxID=341454 RepID=A0A4S2N6K3_9PEZI|nr:hypothetical protein EX30DRAFT_325858 [Ascodesmis nigricans]
MAARRNVKTAQDALQKEGASSPVEGKPKMVTKQPKTTGAAQTVPSSVVAKLLFFTFAMISGPLASYYVSNTMIFPGNSTAAAAIAAVVANVVLIGYILAAISEDDTDQTEGKKSQ